jgi:hypothetical protein
MGFKCRFAFHEKMQISVQFVFAIIRRKTKGNYRHRLDDILLLVLSAVLCGANDWNEIESFGHQQKSWLCKYGSFSRGIPPHDTINRVFSLIKADYILAVKGNQPTLEDDIIAI